MNLRRLCRILWGRKVIILTATTATLVGGVAIILTSPPRYEATTKVMLDIIKPDPVTGFRLSDKGYEAYLSGQFSFIRSEDVTGRAVEAMGWLESPDMVTAWQAAPDKGDDLRRWAARHLAYGVGVDMVPDTNILEIKYQATAPDGARTVADNIRTSYVEASIAQTRDTARASATNLSAQAERERERLVQLQVLKANVERETGIMLSDAGATSDAQRALIAAHAAVNPQQSKTAAPRSRDDTEILKGQLQTIDSSIVAAGRTLGPNNPIMLQMQRRREFVAAQLAGAQPADPVANQTMRRLEAVTALARQSVDRIHSVSDKTLALRLIQDEIKRRRALLDKVSARSGSELEISNVSDANLTPIGITVVAPAPVFPNLPLILGGGGVLGFALGSLIAFIAEAAARRVRGVEDLRTAVKAPLLGVMPAIASRTEPRRQIEKVRPVKAGASRRKVKLANA